MTWTNFHSQCRLLATDHPVTDTAVSRTPALAEQLLRQLQQLPPEQRRQSARLYGQLNFEQTAVKQHHKSVLLYMSLLFVVFIMISVLHLTFVWPGFDDFYQQIEPGLISASAGLRQLWPFIILACAGMLLLGWLYYYAVAGLLRGNNPATLQWLLSKRAQQLQAELVVLHTYPLQIHQPAHTGLQQRLQLLLPDQVLLQCELTQQLQTLQQQLTTALNSRMRALQLLSTIVMLCAIAQLLFINYRHLFDMGVVI